MSKSIRTGATIAALSLCALVSQADQNKAQAQFSFNYNNWGPYGNGVSFGMNTPYYGYPVAYPSTVYQAPVVVAPSYSPWIGGYRPYAQPYWGPRVGAYSRPGFYGNRGWRRW